MRRLLTVKQAAEALALPVQTLYAWRTRRTGPPAIRVGKYLRYDQAELEAWVDEQARVTRAAS